MTSDPTPQVVLDGFLAELRSQLATVVAGVRPVRDLLMEAGYEPGDNLGPVLLDAGDKLDELTRTPAAFAKAHDLAEQAKGAEAERERLRARLQRIGEKAPFDSMAPCFEGPNHSGVHSLGCAFLRVLWLEYVGPWGPDGHPWPGTGEPERQRLYADLAATGLSDAEARGTVWPDQTPLAQPIPEEKK